MNVQIPASALRRPAPPADGAGSVQVHMDAAIAISQT